MENKTKAQVFQQADGSELYGFNHPIAHNEIKEGSKLQMNRDVSPKHSLHSKEAMKIAAQSLQED